MSKTTLKRQGVNLFILSIAVAIFSFLKESVFASYFGISLQADAYTVAIQIPEVMFAIVWEAIHTIVIPLYTEKRKESSESGKRFISCFWTLTASGTILVVVLSEIFAPALITTFAPGLNAEAKNLAADILRWILPALVFEATQRVCMGVLNVHNIFTVTKVLSVFRNLSIIAFVALFASRFGIYAAAYGMLTGIMIECILTIVSTRKYERLEIKFDLKDPSLKKVGKLIAPVIVGTGVSEINKIVNKVIASFLTSGSIAALNYAAKLTSIIETVCLNNIITLVYPSYSRLAAEGHTEALGKMYLKTLSYGTIISLPIIVGGSLLRNQIVEIAFGRGAFDRDAVVIVGLLFACYLINAYFAVVRGACVRLFMSTYQTKIVSVNSVLSMLVNVVLSFVLVKFMGAAGLALATVFATGFACVHLLTKSKVVLPGLRFREIFTVSGKTILACVVMGISVHFIMQLVQPYGTLISLLVSVAGGVVVFGVMLISLKTIDINGILRALMKR